MDSEPENSDNSAIEEDRSGLEARKGVHLGPNEHANQRVKREESSGVESSSEEDEDEEEEEEEESSSYDEEECARRRSECARAMAELEKQFIRLREQLCEERMLQVEQRLEEVGNETADEYVKPLNELQDLTQKRDEVADIYKQFRISDVDHKFESEVNAAKQTYQSECNWLYDNMLMELEEKVRNLEEERGMKQYRSDPGKRHREGGLDGHSERKRKTVTVPFIVYMLKDADILEDWTAIKKAQYFARRKAEQHYEPSSKSVYTAKFEDGKLFYEGNWYLKGMEVWMNGRNSYRATIMSVNTAEVILQRANGGKSRVYISQLQSGEQRIRLTKEQLH